MLDTHVDLNILYTKRKKSLGEQQCHQKPMLGVFTTTKYEDHNPVRFTLTPSGIQISNVNATNLLHN